MSWNLRPGVFKEPQSNLWAEWKTSLHGWQDPTVTFIRFCDTEASSLSPISSRWNFEITLFSGQCMGEWKHLWEHSDCRDRREANICLMAKFKTGQTEKQILYINTYIWNLEKWHRWPYLQSRHRDTVIEKKWPRWEGNPKKREYMYMHNGFTLCTAETNTPVLQLKKKLAKRQQKASSRKPGA